MKSNTINSYSFLFQEMERREKLDASIEEEKQRQDQIAIYNYELLKACPNLRDLANYFFTPNVYLFQNREQSELLPLKFVQINVLRDDLLELRIAISNYSFSINNIGELDFYLILNSKDMAIWMDEKTVLKNVQLTQSFLNHPDHFHYKNKSTIMQEWQENFNSYKEYICNSFKLFKGKIFKELNDFFLCNERFEEIRSLTLSQDLNPCFESLPNDEFGLVYEATSNHVDLRFFNYVLEAELDINLENPDSSDDDRMVNKNFKLLSECKCLGKLMDKYNLSLNEDKYWNEERFAAVPPNFLQLEEVGQNLIFNLSILGMNFKEFQVRNIQLQFSLAQDDTVIWNQENRKRLMEEGVIDIFTNDEVDLYGGFHVEEKWINEPVKAQVVIDYLEKFFDNFKEYKGAVFKELYDFFKAEIRDNSLNELFLE